MQVYSPSAAPGAPITVRHRGVTWTGARDDHGAVMPDQPLIALLHAGGWSVGRLQAEIDLTAIGAEEPFSLKFRVRAISERAAGENRAERVSDFLDQAANADSMVVEWSDLHAAAVLDIDVHEADLPPLNVSYAEMLVPSPFAVKQSRHGGLHCLYLGCGVHSAAGMASLAAFGARDVFPGLTGVEVLTRHRCSPLGWMRVTKPRYKPFAANPYTIDVDEVQEWLTDRGMHVGSRYGHALCPFEPDTGESVDANPSVTVTADGIKCFRCDKFAPWAAILYGSQGGELPPLWRMARARVWWDQAHGWAAFHRPELIKLFDDAYRTALILLNGVERGALRAMTHQALLRSTTGWQLASGDQLAPLDSRQFRRAVDKLPSLYRIPRAGEEDLPPKALMISNLDNMYMSSDLPLPDVPPLNLLQPSFHPDPAALYRDGWTWHRTRPTWTLTPAPPDATDVDLAWKLVEEYFPGVDRRYLSLLLIAHLVSRFETPAQPIILAVTGVSGGGKTNTVRLAAALVAGSCYTANADAGDFNLQVGSALLQKPDLIVVDEYLKRESEASALAIYELGQYYTVTVKYANPVTVPLHCPVILTGICLAPVFRRSTQFLRRVVRVDLRHACHWPKARAENLLDNWNKNRRRRFAADILCSHFAYKYVLNAPDPLTGWNAAIEEFAEHDDDDDTEAVQVDEQIANWLLAVEQYATQSKTSGRMRYFLNLQEENPAVRGWLELCDGPTGPALYCSSRLQERDLTKALKLTHPLHILTSRHRPNVLCLTLKRGRGDLIQVADLNLEQAK